MKNYKTSRLLHPDPLRGFHPPQTPQECGSKGIDGCFAESCDKRTEKVLAGEDLDRRGHGAALSEQQIRAVPSSGECPLS